MVSFAKIRRPHRGQTVIAPGERREPGVSTAPAPHDPERVKQSHLTPSEKLGEKLWTVTIYFALFFI